ncbi:MAG: hypothetical protein EBU76_11320 [Gammaproteobacteria bacterium]|nr:hypothetical protein [Gammaproteobacteria bacterium]
MDTLRDLPSTNAELLVRGSRSKLKLNPTEVDRDTRGDCRRLSPTYNRRSSTFDQPSVTISIGSLAASWNDLFK